MNGFWLWLRVRRLRQYLVVAGSTGLAGCWVGNLVSPVPGQLFADVAGVPLVYLSPVLVAVSLAQSVPVGTYWFEVAPRPLASASVMTAGLVLAFGPPLISSAATQVCQISARNGVLLAALTLCVRKYATAAASCAAVLVPCFMTWTFGWTESGEPQAWALLLADPWSTPALLLAAGLLACGTVGLVQVRSPTGADA